MASTGYIQVHAYTSKAQIPLAGVAITITDTSGSGIAMRLSNRSGKLDAPVAIQVPDLIDSQTPQTEIIPFASVNLYAHMKDYESIEIENLQVFANTITLQNLEMIPLSEFPANWSKTEIFNTPPQNL